MKKAVLFILSLFFFNNLVAQVLAPKNENEEDPLVKLFTWEIERAQKGSLMFLDVPFVRDSAKTYDYISLTIAKEKTLPRPDFISISLPSNVLQSNGVFVHFANIVKDEKGNQKMELAKGNPSKVDFQVCDMKNCIARIIGGYVTDPKSNLTVDVFKKFLEYDHVLFFFVYPDGSHKSIGVPLAIFKKQYESL
jgi:hypothetical protein